MDCPSVLSDEMGSGIGTCRAGVCVDLLADAAGAPDTGCSTILGQQKDENDIFIGYMAPLSGNFAATGLDYVGTMKTAIAEYNAGVANVQPAPPNYVAIVCDESSNNNNPTPAIKHLVESVGVKLIVGPTWPTAIQVVTGLTLGQYASQGVIVMLPLADDPAIQNISSGGTVWGCKPNLSEVVTAWPAVMSRMESIVRSHFSIPTGTPIKVAYLSSADASSADFTNALNSESASILFNGVSQSQNVSSGNFIPATVPDYRTAASTATYQTGVQSAIVSLLSSSAGFAPNLVIVGSSGDEGQDIIKDVESGWTGDDAKRPIYLTLQASGFPRDAGFLKGSSVGRLFAVDVSRDMTVQNNLSYYQADYSSISDGSKPEIQSEFIYDCFWESAYGLRAAINLGHTTVDQVTGSDFITAITAISTLGTSVTQVSVGNQGTGSSGVSTAAALIESKSNFQLIGASSDLQFSIKSGSPLVDNALYCFSSATQATQATGLTYDASTGAEAGTFTACE